MLSSFPVSLCEVPAKSRVQSLETWAASLEMEKKDSY
jgi:hypothetical protein